MLCTALALLGWPGLPSSTAEARVCFVLAVPVCCAGYAAQHLTPAGITNQPLS